MLGHRRTDPVARGPRRRAPAGRGEGPEDGPRSQRPERGCRSQDVIETRPEHARPGLPSWWAPVARADAAVGDGCAAFEAAVACAPDVVLLDVTMPGLDGVEVCRRLRARPDFGAVPILLLTAQAQEAEVARGRAMGADDYVVKPFSPRELLRRVQDALDRRSTTAHPVVAGISSDRRTPG